ncbi:hypothetical protein MAJ_00982, partial [Metarhizium majus ARSEF 297]
MSIPAFIRTPTWITAGFAQSKAGPGGSNFAFSEEQKQTFRADPKAYMDYRKDIESELNSRFKFIITDSPEQEEAVIFTVNGMKEKLGKEPILSGSEYPGRVSPYQGTPQASQLRTYYYGYRVQRTRFLAKRRALRPRHPLAN